MTLRKFRVTTVMSEVATDENQFPSVERHKQTWSGDKNVSGEERLSFRGNAVKRGQWRLLTVEASLLGYVELGLAL